MIIVEGPDGAGKTTLVKELAREFRFMQGERGTTDRSKLYTVTRQDTYTALGHGVSGQTPVRIWDRLFYSELVYAPIVGRECEFSTAEQGYVRRMIDALACPVILCMPDLSVVQETAPGAEQMAGVLDNLEDIWTDYRDLYRSDTFPENVMLYDFTQPEGGRALWLGDGTRVVSLEDIVADIADYLDERAERTWAP